MSDNKMICFLSALLLAWLTLCAGEPDLLDAITRRIYDGRSINSSDTNTTARLDDYGKQLLVLRAETFTNLHLVVGALQRHEQMLQNLATNANKEVLK